MKNNFPKRDQIFLLIPYPMFFLEKNLSRKIDVQQKQFLKDLSLLIVENHFPLQFVESIWLKRFSMHLCPKIILSKNQYSNELLFELVEKTEQLYVLITLVKCHSAIICFDLCMLKVGHDILHW
jgi:hypothetical protein